MGLLKKIFIIVMILFTLNLYLPGIHFAQEIQLSSNWVATESPEIQSTPKPEIRSTPEETIPAKKVVKKKSKWIWFILGIALVGGGAASISGGGDEPSSGDTGTYTGTW